MKTRRTLGALAFLTLISCNQQTSVSGTYLARYTNGAASMQLTESQSGQVMGSLSLVTVKGDGQSERHDASIIGGAVDANGESLVLTVKPNEPFAMAQNVSGQISRQGIDVVMPWGSSHFVPEKPGEFDAAINNLVVVGKQQELLQAQAQQMATDAQHVSELTQALTAYNNRIEANPNGPAIARGQEEQVLAAAQRDLGILKDLEAQGKEIPANQVRFRINQLAFQMGQMKFQVDQALNQGREHISGFDQRLANSPCFVNARIEGCDTLGQEKLRYAKVREHVLSIRGQLAADMQKNGTAMDAINKQAGN